MNRTIAKIISLPGTVIHFMVIPLFALIFTLYYRPSIVYEFMNMENVSFSFNTTMLFCILIVSISITRWSLFALGRYHRVSPTYYFFWCIGETLVTSLFCALYLVLVSTDELSFFEISGMVFLNLLTILVYPYVIVWLCFERYLKNSDISSPVDENSLIRFYDEYNKLRIVIAQEAVIFIRSEDNYVQIHYLDRGMTKKFILRSTMRALEPDLLKRGLVRCHRSYFINPSYIKIVHRDQTGQIVAELNQDGFDSIPISRKFQDQVTKLL